MARNGDTGDPIEQFFLNEYPNPQRIGCPGSAILSKIARKQLPVDLSALKHVAECSPCFRDIKSLQQSSRQTWKRLAAAAVLIIVSAVSAYLFVRQPWNLNSSKSPLHSKPSTSVPPDLHSGTLESAVLNFETLSGDRGLLPGLNQAAELQRLPQNQISLSIYLPKGSEPGKYQIKLLKKKTDHAPLMEAAGTAHIQTGLTVLLMTVDFTQLKSGTYIFAFRRESGEWHYSRVVIS